MALVTHLIEALTVGGAARATIYLAKYSSRNGQHRHRIISIKPPEPAALKVAEECGIEVFHTKQYDEIYRALEQSDLVQVSWWNNPTLYNVFQLDLPPMRLLGWMHVGGETAPQIITPRVLEFFDYSIACSPFTYRSSAFRSGD